MIKTVLTARINSQSLSKYGKKRLNIRGRYGIGVRKCLSSTFLACIGSFTLCICLIPVLFMFTTPALAEEGTVKFRALEGGFLYSFPFNQSGGDINYVWGSGLLHNVLELGFRHQQLNPYDRTNREYRFGYALRLNLPVWDKFAVQLQPYFSAGVNVVFLEDIENPDPLFDDKVWRSGVGLQGKAGLQIPVHEMWAMDVSLLLNSGLASGYPRDYAPINVSSQTYTYIYALPRIGVSYYFSSR